MSSQRLPNGAGAAAVVAAGLGGMVMAVLAIVADHQPAFKKMLIFSAPVGALSGESTGAVAVWLVSWVVLDIAWKRQDVRSAWIGVGLGLLLLSFVLMIPGVGDLL